MKVAFTEEMKKYVSVAEAPYARQIIKDLKEDTGLKGYAEMAARLAGGQDSYEILKATAEICKNARVYDAYGDGTGKLDVWLKVYAFNPHKGFFSIGVCLTDIWAVDGENSEEIKSRMYISHYRAA